MKYTVDTEFIEDGSTITLLSIGMVSQTGRKLYLVNGEAMNHVTLDRASDWVKEHVIPNLNPTPENTVSLDMMRHLILDFVHLRFNQRPDDEPVETWGYYADYDHVALAQLWGPMVNLPAGMPMFMMDLKQWAVQLGNPTLPPAPTRHNALEDAMWQMQVLKMLTEEDKRLRGKVTDVHQRYIEALEDRLIEYRQMLLGARTHAEDLHEQIRLIRTEVTSLSLEK